MAAQNQPAMESSPSARQAADPASSRPVGRPHLAFEDRSENARGRLACVLQEVFEGNGAYQFILLRESPLDDRLIDHGDVDLLGTQIGIASLLSTVLAAAVRGDVHFRVTSSKPEKVQLTVFSADLAHRATFDLWIRLPQLGGGRFFVASCDLMEHARPMTPAISRLPSCVEAALYLQHLAAKRKPLDEPHTRSRIETFAAHDCGRADCAVNAWFHSILTRREVTPAALAESLADLERRLGVSWKDGRHFHVRSPRRRPKRPSAVCFCGVDGVGKTTLIHSLDRDPVIADGVLTGKRLYRRSWVYQWLTRGRRGRAGASREAFDERHCVPLFVRAALTLSARLAMRTLRRRGTLLIDRCLADFLFVARKTDAGFFHRAADWILSRGPQLPTIQLVAPHETTSRRKAEMTVVGHDRYDAAMLRQLTRQAPFDHMVFHNGASTDVAIRGLTRYLSEVLRTRPAPGARGGLQALSSTRRPPR